MSDPVAFLTAALAHAEETARATTPVPVAGVWAAVRDKDANEGAPAEVIQGQDPDEPDCQGYSYGLPVIAIAADWQAEAEANLRHIAMHDPAAVLRRVAADREILAEHANDGCGDCTVCARESEERNGLGYAFHEPLPWPCRTVLRLAQAWGWEEEETT